MKTVLYYFSGTGNSLAVARDLAQALGETELVAVTRAFREQPPPGVQFCGVVFPVYMFGLPLAVRDFLKSAPLARDAYWFAVATMGGLVGGALTQARGLLAERGITLSCGFGIRMPGNYTPLYGAESPLKQRALFQKKEQRIKEVSVAVRMRETGIWQEGPLLLNRFLHRLLYAKGSARIPAADRGFWVSDRCTQCGLCAKVCPAANIELKDGRPHWLHHCQHCMACLQWCPAEAIEYQKSTAGRRRYRHPDVSAQDIMLQRP